VDSSVSNLSLAIPGYELFRKDRNLHGGGVCFYAMSVLGARLLLPGNGNGHATTSHPDVESLHLMLTVSPQTMPMKLLFTTVYRPPSSGVQFWEHLSAELDSISTAHPTGHAVVLGDLNTDVLKCTSHHYRHLQQLCVEQCIRNVITSPTRAPSNTCLDLVLLPTTVETSIPSVVTLDDLSDHHLVTLSIHVPRCDLPSTREYYYVRRPGLNAVDNDKFQSDLNRSLGAHPNLETPDDMAEYFTKSVNDTIALHAPLKKVMKPRFTKPKPQPWVTRELAKLLQYRRTLHRRSKSRPNDQDLKQKYRAVRREGKLLNKRLKSAYLIEQFQALKNNPRSQWSLLNSLAGRKSVRTKPKAALCDLTNTFAGTVHDPNRPQQLLPPAVTDTHPDSPILSTFSPVSVESVCDLLKNLHTSKSAGSDGIQPGILKTSRDTLAPYLTDILNESLATGSVPSMYKSAHVCPVFKAGDPTAATNYRPISLLPICSKLLEKVVHRQLIKFFDDHHIQYAPEQQFAYRAHHSCEDALVLATEKWRHALDKKQYCGVVLADMTKAFDRVLHRDLVDELHTLGLRGTVLGWMADYLAHRTQTVVLGDSVGEKRPCTRGVPQGSVLGPLLFCIYIRSAPACFKHSLSQLYADDIAFYISKSRCLSHQQGLAPQPKQDDVLIAAPPRSRTA